MNSSETKLRILNLALTKLRITERLVSATQDTTTANTLNAVYDQVLNAVLELGEWRCARKRVTLERVKDSVEGATQADPVVITATAHAFEDGDLVKFTEVGGMTELNDNTYMVANKADDTFELYDENGTVSLDGSAFGAYTSGGYIWKIPNWDYSYMFKLPDDCIKVLDTEWGPEKGGWVEEDNHILTNEEDDELSIQYIRYLTDVTKFSPLLVLCVATFLAITAGAAIKADTEQLNKLDAEFAGYLALAKEQDIRHRRNTNQPTGNVIDV